MSTTSNNNNNSQPEDKQNKSDTIKFALVCQENSNINAYELLSTFFAKIKLNKYSIKDKFHYEFSPSGNQNLLITINNLKKVEKIYEHYKKFDFFLIFIDVQNSKCIDFLEKAIDIVIDAGEYNYNKKCYIFGFYFDENKKSIPEEKITTIIDAKGIEYYYLQLKNDEYTKFGKTLDSVVNDSNTIIVEKFLNQKHSEIILDNSNSHCFIF